MIIVCSLNDLVSVCNSIKPKYLISVIDPGYAPDTPDKVEKHLKLGFDDITKISEDNIMFRTNIDSIPQLLPNEQHEESIINFTKDCKVKDDIVVHCWCGVSRSMAVAIFIFCKIFPNNIESNVRYMRSIAAHANPNKLMVSLFEKYLNIEGQISEAFKKYPYTITYDCDTNFAPVSIFKINEILNFK